MTMNGPQYSKGEQRYRQDLRTSPHSFENKIVHHSVKESTGLHTNCGNDIRYRCVTLDHSSHQYATSLVNERTKHMVTNLNNVPPCVTVPVSNNNFAALHVSSTLHSNSTPVTISTPCYTGPPRKVDASTMTDKELESYAGPSQPDYSDKIIGTSATYTVQTIVPTPGWQSLAGPPGSTVAEYLSRLPASTLPLTLHHFLKFSNVAENNLPEIKREDGSGKKKRKRKYKKKPYIPRPPRPKPGEIRLTTALDGSTLYCCPECHMAYPDRSLLEQHMVLHKLERRFVCDICGAGLKRKEHLDRHKQGHSPDRPFVCTVCLKAFKRNEHLSRHFITHSGEKTQVCIECGKAFYRKDHLRKHSQSHIAKRLRAEIMGQKNENENGVVAFDSVMAMGHNIAPAHNVTIPILSSSAASVPVLS